MKPRKLFLNLPVRNLKASMEFFAKLGFEFNPKFTDDKAACMIISPESSVMLLQEEFFKTFVPAGKQLCDTATQVEALFCFSCDSRGEVDELVSTALAEGASKADEKPEDHGFMYARSFFDLDGHGWQVMWMDPAVAQLATAG